MFLKAAHTANQEEHELTVRNALTLHWKAIMLSLIILITISMEGYDTG
jgi:hypothetical protein